MIRRTLILVLCAWCAAVGAGHAQQPGVLVSGLTTPGHPAMWITNGVIGDGGSALSGNLTELGITNTGAPFCINDAPITGQYHQLCFGANAAGGGLVSYNAYGGAPPLPLNCNINGVSGPCLISPSAFAFNVAAGGATCNGTTDDSAAINAAAASHAAIVFPVTPCRAASTIVFPDNLEASSQGQQPQSASTIPNIVCDIGVSPCVRVGNNDNKPNRIHDLTIAHAPGTSSSECIEFNGGQNVVAEDIQCLGFGQGFVVDNHGVTGIYFIGSRLFTCGTTDADVVVSGPPGVYINQSIFGCNGPGDVVHNEFVKVTGNWDNTLGTVHFTDTHFNLGNNTVTCAFSFQNFTGTTNKMLDFEVIGGHLETAQNVFCSDSTVKYLIYTQVIGLWAQGGWGGTNKVLALDPATNLAGWVLSGDTFAGFTDATFAQSTMDDVKVTGTAFSSTPVVVTGNGANTHVAFTGNSYNGLTLHGTFGGATNGFGSVFSGDAHNGPGTYSYDANLGVVAINIPGESRMPCNVVLAFAGGSGLTQHGSCYWTDYGDSVELEVTVFVTALGTSSGNATLAGLPLIVDTMSFGTQSCYYTAMSGLSGLFAATAPSQVYANLYTGSATSVVPVTVANFTGTTNISCHLSYLLPQ